MWIERIEIEQLTVYQAEGNSISADLVSDIFCNSLSEIVFVVKNDESLNGIITWGDFKKQKDFNSIIEINDNFKYLYDDEQMLERITSIFNANDNINLFPILTKDRKLSFAIKKINQNNLTGSRDLYSKFITMDKSVMHTTMTHITEKYKRIGFWGTDDIGLAICSLIFEDTKQYVRYIISKREKEDISGQQVLEASLDITPISSLGELEQHNFDCVIVSENVRYDMINNFYKNIKVIKLYDLASFIAKHQLRNSINKIIHYSKEQCGRKGLKTLCVAVPTLDEMEVVTANERRRNDYMVTPSGNSTIDDNDIKLLYGDDEAEYFHELKMCINNRPGLLKKGDLRIYADYSSKYMNIFEGERFTVNQPDFYFNNIYIIGSCLVNSTYAEDNHTISSVLQKKVNSNFLNKYRVVAYGGSGTALWKYYVNILKYIELRSDDIIIFLDESWCMDKMDIDIDLTDSFNRLHCEGEFFWDKPSHCNYKGYERIGEEIYNYLSKGILSSELVEKEIIQQMNQTGFFSSIAENSMFKAFIEELGKYKINITGKIGAVVMNCNPFTYGHQYLIEQSLKEVDYLYIFILEENKSYFSFKDRISLVEKAVITHNNVKVIPGGRFILSSVTFPEYFDKENNGDIQVNPSLDLEIFSRYIAPILGITVRFVGEEPYCKITNQYNRKMKEILLKNGVDVKVIPRKMLDSEFISASKIRSYLNDGDFDQIRKMVPESTFKFLLSRRDIS